MTKNLDQLLNAKLTLETIIQELNEKHLKRKKLIDLFVIAYLIKEHIFVGGTAGTGKTSLAKDVAKAMQGSSFYYLMSKTTTLDEIIGSIDIGALNQGKLIRDLSTGVANADIVILDEGFKANSVCLNALLGLMLDREVVNGGQTVTCPLNTMMICSNELPEEETLAPFWDRLVLKDWVSNLNRRQTVKLLNRQLLNTNPQVTTKLSQAEIDILRSQIDQVKISEDILQALTNITFELKQEINLITSTRKHNQILPVLKAYAFINNRDYVDEDDLEILENILWQEVEQIPAIKDAINKFSNPLKQEIDRLLQIAQAEFDQVAPYDVTQESRATWINRKSKIDIRLEEIQAEYQRLALTNTSIATKTFYLSGQKSLDTMVQTLNQYTQNAYGTKAKEVDDNFSSEEIKQAISPFKLISPFE